MSFIEDVRSKVGGWLLGEQMKDLTAEAQAFRAAYRHSPHWFVVGMPENMLQEMDRQYLDLLQHRLGYDVLLGHGALVGNMAAPTETDRLRAVNESRHAYRYDVLTWFGIGLWVNIAFGYNIDVVPEDERLKEVWDDFWEADRNACILASDNIRTRLARTHLVDGEIFGVVYVSTVDGSCTIRLFPTEEIKGGPNGNGLIYKTGDRDTILYYRREFTDNGTQKIVYYPDYMAEESDLVTAVLPDDGVKYENTVTMLVGSDDTSYPATEAYIIHHTFDSQGGRGWPLSSPRAIPWSRVFRDYAQDRATVQRQAATGMEDWTVDGGSRPISQLRTKFGSSLASSTDALETNPPPGVGSPFIHNRAVERKRMPMNTGASDSEHDGLMFHRMAGLGLGAYPHYMGVGDTTRLASTYSMELPQLRSFNGYQLDWSAFFRKLLRLVSWAAQEYGGETISKEDADITLDDVITPDITTTIAAVGQFMKDSILPFSSVQPPEVTMAIVKELWVMALKTLGIKDATDIIEDATEEAQLRIKKEKEAETQPVEVTDADIEQTVEEVAKLLGQRYSQ